MLLAKIAMDIEAKHTPNNIAKWTYNDIKEKLWTITPLSNMWGIGKRMEKNLNRLGIFSVGDLARSNKYMLKDKFGIMGTELWNHANGIDTSIISDYKISSKSESYSHSQVLFKDYNEKNIKLIISEMVDVLSERLHKGNKLTRCISLGISYSKEIGGGFYHSIKLDHATDSSLEIYKYLLNIFDKFYEFLPIRKVSICLGILEKQENFQFSLFDLQSEKRKKENTNDAIEKIKFKYGKNSLLKATSLLEDSTICERNKKTGGHYS